LRSSWLSRLIAGLGHRRGRLITGLVYLLGPRAFTRQFYLEQGRCAGDRFAGGRGALSLSFDVDYPEDVQALGPVCDTLEQLGLKASFAVIGKWVEKYPAEHRLLIEAGHEILNHTYTHPDHEILHPGEPFDSLADTRQKDEIIRCHDACGDVLGTVPQGFRAPHFGNVTGRGFYSMLAETGYRFSSSVISVDSPGFGLPFEASQGIWEFPVSCCPMHPFAVLDTWNAFRKKGAKHAGPGRFAALITEAAALVSANGGYLNLYLDPRDVVEFEEARRGVECLKPGPDVPFAVTYSHLLEQLSAS
jgi:peptidoglycan-N-acetylglucosamine deacetylase